MATTTKTRGGAANESDASGQWTDDEIAAMKERASELKTAKKRGGDKAAEDEADLRAKIEAMPKGDRDMAERIHAIVTATAPELEPKTWYGMPAWARDGKLVVFFKAASKFKSRYATLGFEEHARLDDGEMWSTSYALTRLTPAAEKRIADLVRKAAG